MARKKNDKKKDTKKKTLEEQMKEIRLLQEKVRLADGMLQNIMGIKKQMHESFEKKNDGTVKYGTVLPEFKDVLKTANTLESELLKKSQTIKTSLTKLKNKTV